MAPRANLFTIPPGVPFLDTLVARLLEGRLVPGVDASDPYALADLTLYLPTRRAARAVRDSFVRALDRPVLLPRIRPLGDIDEDEAELADGLGDDSAEPVPPAAAPAERQLVLTEMILGWSGALVRAAAGFPDEPLMVPASPADAARLAGALAALMDQVEGERVGWEALPKIVDGDLSLYWDITLEFLKIVTQAWPAHLAERGLIDPGARRNALIRREAERLKTRGSPHPVVAAGSTGSVPATAELLRAIAGLPNGAVVLPGLDRHLDEADWQAIDADEGDPARAGHPQYGLKRLIDALGVRREAVELLAEPPAPLAARGRFVSEAMRPAETTDRWAGLGLAEVERSAALAGIGVVEAANEREEALAVALLLRRALNDRPHAVAALVTPDRGLAERVAIELERWGLRVDDSAGAPLARTPPGVLASLVAEVALGGAAPETLLALLKHPLCFVGLDGGEVRAAARALERAALRGPRLRPGLAAVAHALHQAGEARQAGRRPSEAARCLADGAWRAAADLLDRLAAALAPLCRLAESSRPVPLKALLTAHLAAIEAVTRDAGGACPALAEGDAGTALAAELAELTEAAPRGPAVRPRDYPSLFAALLAERMVQPRGGADPRIHIWGTLEARLQHADTIVLGSLNEGTWPGRTRSDPFLSRPMRTALGLEPPERRLGLAAHDFAQALGHADVWLTRAARRDGEPQVASRWLQRLQALAGEAGREALAARGHDVLALARQVDAPAGPPRAIAPPEPRPPLDRRPKQLSVTQIETLIRDPYAIYARHVLGLRPFEPLGAEPDASDRGSLIHDILARFVAERPAGPFDEATAKRLMAIGREAFAALDDFPETQTLWWPRFEVIARWFVAQEAARADVRHRAVEIDGARDCDGGLRLTVRADRIDRLADGSLRIVDYKTGAPPSQDQVLALAPQLLLEALIAEAGGFEGVPAATVAELEYYRLSGRGDGGSAEPRGFRPDGKKKPEVTLRQAIATTEGRLRELIAGYADRATAYVSRRVPRSVGDFSGDYDHLARAAEWSVGGEE
jgi:ATP-dependent helicase/nuclease subunit B